MRDKMFVAGHRGGSLTLERHRMLMKWAYGCVEHVLPLLTERTDTAVENALLTAKEWEKGNVSVGEARKAAYLTIALANESKNPISAAIARAAGQAVSTAHMSDHSLGAALYALKAVKNAGKSADDERKWQNEQLPPEIREMVLKAMIIKEKGLKI